MKIYMTRILAIILVALLLVGCTPMDWFGLNDRTLNGVALDDYTIVYSDAAPDYCKRAARYIYEQVLARTGLKLAVRKDNEGTYGHEILVGDTNRELSQKVKAQSRNMEFYFTADDNHIAMNADYFIIAAAAYYFIETYIPGDSFKSTIAKNEVIARKPITEEANNIIFLIGDGMGFNHTKLLEDYDIGEMISEGINLLFERSDNEDIFYGYYLPYQGSLRTNSLSGTTDSAAAATALACGYKTVNRYLGLDWKGNEIQSLTELAGSLGMSTAVLSTEDHTGATPGGFSSHVLDRSYGAEIFEDQTKLSAEIGTLIKCGLNENLQFEEVITDVLHNLEDNENGFFLMYEEAYIDKNSHSNLLMSAMMCVARFNQAIGVFMEHAFYHPDTLVIITADHETGGLTRREDGFYKFTSTDHSSADVPIFAYGYGAEVFAD
ncbi:MAG: alkaline phosphatase, partial [Oscillospiraceae bacterium]|nr:alkaline phosphatase [Oscillospiraceae bacterium]